MEVSKKNGLTSYLVGMPFLGDPRNVGKVENENVLKAEMPPKIRTARLWLMQ